MTGLIIGAGEIGKSLWNILSEYYPTDLVDKNEQEYPHFGNPDIIHICFPFSNGFISEVARYQQKYRPRYTVIHSTVLSGTSRLCNAIHSPVIGMHPNLDESLLTFTKFLGGEEASEVADYFRKAGMRVYLFDKQETTEWMKLLDTTFYKKCIEYTQEVKRICITQDIPFEAWTMWTENYNKGYQKLGYPEFTRPNLVPIMTEIGGHCLIPNEKILQESLHEQKDTEKK